MEVRPGNSSLQKDLSASMAAAANTLWVRQHLFSPANQTASLAGCEISIFNCAGADTDTQGTQRDTVRCCGLAAEEQVFSRMRRLAVWLAACVAFFCGKCNLHKLEFLLPMRWAAMRPSFPSFFFISLSRTRIFCPLLCRRRLPQGRYQNAVFLLPASLWPRASCSHKSAKVVPPSHVAHFDSSDNTKETE